MTSIKRLLPISVLFIFRFFGSAFYGVGGAIDEDFFILMTQLNAHTYGHIIKLDSHENVFGGLSKHVHIIIIIIISYYRVKRLPTHRGLKNKSFRN
jgi:hypothetical protein